MEAEPQLYPVAGAVGAQGDEDQLGVPDGPEAPLDELVGAYPNYNEQEEERRYYRRKRLGVLTNVLAASAGGMLTYGVYLGLLQMQLILHYDETYREVKYGNMGLPDIDSKMLMGINVTPIVALLYTPVLIRFFGTKWMMFLAVGIYALFVSTNYWERYYTLVPSAVALGMAIVPLWASMGNYITRMAQKYYEYSHYKEQDEQGPQQRPPRGSHAPYLLVFQAIFYSFFHLSFACAQLPMIYFLNHYLYDLNHTLYKVQNCGTNSQGILTGFNKTVLRTLPRSRNLIVVESVLMAVAFLAMLLVLGLCGAAYRPTEEIDLRSVGWGNIFQLPFKHVRDFRLRHLVPFFIYSGFEVLFACTGLALEPSHKPRRKLALRWPREGRTWPEVRPRGESQSLGRLTSNPHLCSPRAMACARWGWNAWRTSSWLIAWVPRPPRHWACWGCGCHARRPWWPGLGCTCCSLSASFSGPPRPGSCNTSGSSMQ
ncbi:protein unc-93 homolog B1 isoform X2 [Phocoena sinus]|uniref:protein unc-93 homolog B1 isoform X2 n=1 Tax=Phocoena sinus TaxID=42100 RepID=UPI0013C539D6|nr:protein unc-93 homolog B1 isoform X2 [Phocoena sinus]